MRMQLRATEAQAQWGVTVLRMGVGAIFLAHGLQKVLVTGMPGVAAFMEQAGIPLPMGSAILVTAVETLYRKVEDKPDSFAAQSALREALFLFQEKKLRLVLMLDPFRLLLPDG